MTCPAFPPSDWSAHLASTASGTSQGQAVRASECRIPLSLTPFGAEVVPSDQAFGCPAPLRYRALPQISVASEE